MISVLPLLVFLFSMRDVAFATEAVPQVCDNISSQQVELPQWEDLGLENILFVGGQSTVAAPTVMRLPYNTMMGMPFAVVERQTVQSFFLMSRSALPHRACDNYIYVILSLRL